MLLVLTLSIGLESGFCWSDPDSLNPLITGGIKLSLGVAMPERNSARIDA